MNKKQYSEVWNPPQTTSPEGLDGAACCASFTPGPWSVLYHKDGGFSVVGADGQEVCDTYTNTPRPASESDANAQLIAEAPNTLDVLMELVEIVQDAIERRSMEDMDGFTLQPARAVIAKFIRHNAKVVAPPPQDSAST